MTSTGNVRSTHMLWKGHLKYLIESMFLGNLEPVLKVQPYSTFQRSHWTCVFPQVWFQGWIYGGDQYGSRSQGPACEAFISETVSPFGWPGCYGCHSQPSTTRWAFFQAIPPGQSPKAASDRDNKLVLFYVNVIKDVYVCLISLRRKPQCWVL